jgi:DNA-directed RNA polymerase subunit M/transcription elongation factor TFIIS
MNQVADRLVVVATFLEPNEAHIARARLDAEGIQAILDGEHHVAMNWMISNAIGGVKLLVPEPDFEVARGILHEHAPEILDEETGDETTAETTAETTGDTIAETESDSCPSCQSTNVYRERMNRRLVFLSILLLGIPFPFLSRKMVCHRCGHRWSARA